MPSIMPIKPLLQLFFFLENKKLPVDWEQPSGDPAGSQYADSHPASEKAWIPKLIPPWFHPASTYKGHVETCDEIGEKFKAFAEAAVDNVKMSHDMWRMQAKFKDLKVMSVCAIGTPGCLDGPELKGLPGLATWISTNSNETKYIKAVKEGVSKKYKEWQDKVMIPGLPFYPAFAAFPGPSAPPLPNIPFPLIAAPSMKMTSITLGSQLKSAMVDALDSGLKDEDSDKQHEALFHCIGEVLAMAFLMWLPMQQIMLVLGKGPIPTFAPPYVPVGPVVGGDNIATPGHLMV